MKNVLGLAVFCDILILTSVVPIGIDVLVTEYVLNTLF
jgi:hypothetical protein